MAQAIELTRKVFPELFIDEWQQLLDDRALYQKLDEARFAESDTLSETTGIGAEFLREFRRVLYLMEKPPGRDNDYRVDILAAAFRSPYTGLGAQGLYEYLTVMHQRAFFCHFPNMHYARFCPVIQSSGSGKTRTIFELANKGVLVVYINLRDPTDETPGNVYWPPPTPHASKWLNCYKGNAQEYADRCCYYFAAILIQLKDRLEQLRTQYTTPEEVLGAWSKRMLGTGWSNARTQYFTRVHDQCERLISRPHEDREPRNNVTRDYYVGGRGGNPADVMYTALINLVSSYGEFFKVTDGKPKLVIALDDAHFLNRTTAEGYRPSRILCHVISYLTATYQRAWVVFASTNAWITEIDVPEHSYLIRGSRLFSPYTLMDWDQSAPDLEMLLEDPERISVARYLIRFGRPLWWALRGLGMMQLVRLACSKLVTPTPYTSNRSQTYNSLAILSQRLDLRIALGHQEAAAFIDDAIANHLRICLGTPEDRRWRSTTYGSEPFLSHVAAVLLERDSSVFGALQETVRSGLIEREDGGGLACRALLLVGKDVCLRTRYNKRFGVEPTLDHELFYCRPVSVLAYLETLFGPRIYPADEVAKAGVQEDFKNARVNFSHWNSMSENIHTSTHEHWDCKEWLFRHYARTSAVQCCDSQELVDQVIPLYFDEANRTPRTLDRMSLIMVSDRVTQDSNRTHLDTILRSDRSINCVTEKPSIAILLDAGLRVSETSSSYDPHLELKDRTWRIYVSGVGEESLPFLDQLDSAFLACVLEKLTDPTLLPSAQCPNAEELRCRTQFGATSRRSHVG